MFGVHHNLSRISKMKTLNLVLLLFVSVCADTVGQTNPVAEVRFAPKTIKVVDETTGQPLSGAVVHPIHLQLTNAYAAKTYLTDSNGIAKPIVDVADYSAFKVTKDGYSWTKWAFFEHSSTNRVIRMRPTESRPRIR